jgi:hypothetical protein
LKWRIYDEQERKAYNNKKFLENFKKGIDKWVKVWYNILVREVRRMRNGKKFPIAIPLTLPLKREKRKTKWKKYLQEQKCKTK